MIMSHLAIRDLENDQVLDQSAMSRIRGGYTPDGYKDSYKMPYGVSFADATGSALAIGPNAFTKTDTFAVAVPGASSAGSHSTASVGIPVA
jgi:hypothetical protein